jgi:hypothetical protein
VNHFGWPRVLLGGCAAILLLIAGCGSSSNALGPGQGGFNVESAVEPVGEPYYAGFAGFTVVGPHPVHVLRATVLGVPPGLTVVGVYAVSMKESDNPGQNGHYIGGGDEAHVKADYPRLRLHPVTDAVIPPGTGEGDWYLLVVLRSNRPGTFVTSGLRVEYESNGETGSETFPQTVTVHSAVGATFAPFASPRPSAG